MHTVLQIHLSVLRNSYHPRHHSADIILTLGLGQQWLYSPHTVAASAYTKFGWSQSDTLALARPTTSTTQPSGQSALLSSNAQASADKV